VKHNKSEFDTPFFGVFKNTIFKALEGGLSEKHKKNSGKMRKLQMRKE